MTNKLFIGLHNVAEWITRLFYLNILWIIFTLSGLVVFGIFPATVAVFTVIRHWVLGEGQVPLFKTFWYAFKGSFVQIQLIGYTLALIGSILYIDYNFFSSRDESIFLVAELLTGSAMFVLAIVFLYIFPVYVHFKLKTIEYIKNALLIGLSHLFHSILMFIVTAIFFYGFMKYFGFFGLFIVSMTAFWVTWISQMVFKRIEILKAKKVPLRSME